MSFVERPSIRGRKRSQSVPWAKESVHFAKKLSDHEGKFTKICHIVKGNDVTYVLVTELHNKSFIYEV
jgi:hypothetical protein